MQRRTNTSRAAKDICDRSKHMATTSVFCHFGNWRSCTYIYIYIHGAEPSSSKAFQEQPDYLLRLLGMPSQPKQRRDAVAELVRPPVPLNRVLGYSRIPGILVTPGSIKQNYLSKEAVHSRPIWVELRVEAVFASHRSVPCQN